MSLSTLTSLVRGLGALLAYSILGFLIYSIWRGAHRPAGRTTGRTSAWLRSPWFYLLASALFFGACLLGWRPMPWPAAPAWRAGLLALGTGLYFPGLALLLWGRLALGKNYFVSTGLGAQLFADHQLITGGPYALVRHPMYVGLILAAWGSLLIYSTWTALGFALCAPMIIGRARREEAALAAEFGAQWQAYCQRVPMLIPRLWRRPTV
jgi:protein-S-isoprenylcysteine O-methyltransferase Ste14